MAIWNRLVTVVGTVERNLAPPEAAVLLLFHHSSQREGKHDVSHSAGAPNAVCQECRHQLSLYNQVTLLLR